MEEITSEREKKEKPKREAWAGERDNEKVRRRNKKMYERETRAV